MRTTLCPHCEKEIEVVGYKRDDPVLACGHVLSIQAQLERDAIANGIMNSFRYLILEEMKASNISYKDAESRIVSWFNRE